MSLAENLLNTLAETDAVANASSVVIEEPVVIDENRNIIVPNKLKTIAVVGDKNVETVTFKCIRFWDVEHDLSTFGIYINYTLPNNKTGTYVPTIKNVYEDHFTFDWVIGTEMTKYSGQISFVILAKKVDDDGILQYQWSSLISKDFTVVQGIGVGNIIQDKPTEDLITLLAQNADVLVNLPQTIGDIDAALDAILEIQESLIPKKPTFSIQPISGDTLTCEFDEGMMWSDWCNSEYNTIGAYVENDQWIALNGRYIRTSDSFEVAVWDYITAGETYYA